MAEPSKAEILSVAPLSQGYVKLFRARVRLPDGAEVDREIESHGDAACVLPYDAERRMALMVSGPRMPVIHALGRDHRLLEAPAGMLEGMDPQACARKEAEEEAGLILRELEPVGWTWSSPGVSTERISLFLAPYRPSDRIGAGGGAVGEHENIEVREVALTSLWAMAQDTGQAFDLKTLALVQALKLRRPDLFGPDACA
jgi:nudix-type nucleoside diphosphatase (YffH/AdpP family)